MAIVGSKIIVNIQVNTQNYTTDKGRFKNSDWGGLVNSWGGGGQRFCAKILGGGGQRFCAKIMGVKDFLQKLWGVR
jgi:hypothetical protein